MNEENTEVEDLDTDATETEEVAEPDTMSQEEYEALETQRATAEFIDRYKLMSRGEGTGLDYKQTPYLAEYTVSFFNGSAYSSAEVRELSLRDLVQEAVDSPNVDPEQVIDWYTDVLKKFNEGEQIRQDEQKKAEEAAKKAEQEKAAALDALLARVDKLTGGA